VHLVHGGAQVTVVTGEAGTGKTTILRHLYETLPTARFDAVLVALVKPETAPGWLAPRLAAYLGVDPAIVRGGDLGSLVTAVAARLDELVAARKSLVVLVDAAQRLVAPEAFGELAAFLSFKELAAPCLSVVLAGDAALTATLEATPEIATRLAYTVTLAPLSRAALSPYLDLWLRASGLPSPFTSDALDALHRLTRGVPALVNPLAENALFEAFKRRQRQVEDADVVSASLHVAAGLLARPGGAAAPARAARGEPEAGAPTRAAEAAKAAAPAPKRAVPRAAPEAKAPEAPAPGPPKKNADAPRRKGRRGEAATDADGANVPLASLFKTNADAKD
jgi:general secretion pathway protein A